jgi:hypothetical protein
MDFQGTKDKMQFDHPAGTYGWSFVFSESGHIALRAPAFQGRRHTIPGHRSYHALAPVVCRLVNAVLLTPSTYSHATLLASLSLLRPFVQLVFLLLFSNTHETAPFFSANPGEMPTQAALFIEHSPTIYRLPQGAGCFDGYNL